MKIGSLFSGIGGLELGLERAGVGSTVWQCEIDPYARAVLAKHWPDAIRFDDITKMHDVPPVDLICGGFPCQDISNAGKRVGIDGARSGLFFELMRVVRLVRPRFVVLENVAALLGRGMGDVLGELSESGYDAEWDCVPASSVGAHHRRDRVFIIGILDHSERSGLQACGSGRSRGDADLRERNERAGHLQAAQESGFGADVADPARHVEGRPVERAIGERTRPRGESGDVADAESGSSRSGNDVCGRESDAREGRWNVGGTWLPEPDVGRVAHGIPSRVDRLKCLGNAVVPQVAEVVGRRVVELMAGVQPELFA